MLLIVFDVGDNTCPTTKKPATAPEKLFVHKDPALPEIMADSALT